MPACAVAARWTGEASRRLLDALKSSCLIWQVEDLQQERSQLQSALAALQDGVQGDLLQQQVWPGHQNDRVAGLSPRNRNMSMQAQNCCNPRFCCVAELGAGRPVVAAGVRVCDCHTMETPDLLKSVSDRFTALSQHCFGSTVSCCIQCQHRRWQHVCAHRCASVPCAGE